MIHYSRLDCGLYNMNNKVNWSIVDNNINLSEAFTEFLSIILASGYYTIHLSSLLNIDPYIYLINYYI